MFVNQHRQPDHQNYVPLGILYIASTLVQHGYCVEFIDYQLFSHAAAFDHELFIRSIAETAPVVGFSCMSNLLPFTILCAETLKKLKPDCTIVLGGVGPSPVAKQIIDAFPFIDHVVAGEGELNMLDIMKGTGSALPARRFADTLDMLPAPAYSLLNFQYYNAAPSLVASRGCPYHCAFCSEPQNFGGAVRFRGIEQIVDELEYLHSRTGRTMFLFQDDTMPVNRSRYSDLMQALRNLSFPIQWKCFSRVDLMDVELMKEMVGSGCVQIRYGIESGCNKTLDKIQKGFTIEKAYEVTKLSVDYFLSVHTSFIWGYPFEEIKDMQETLSWVRKFQDIHASVLLFEYCPLPGTRLHNEFNEDLQFSKEKYSFYVVTGHEVLDENATYVTNKSHDIIYNMIEKYPDIFVAFYHYNNRSAFEKRKQFETFNTTRRTSVKNEYDL